MDKSLRFLARRPILSRILLAIFVALPYAVILMLLGFDRISCWICTAALLFCGFVIIGHAPGLLMNRAIRSLTEQCDPDPLLDMTQWLLPLRMNASMKLTVRINHATALREVGRYEEALAELDGIAINHVRGATPIIKYVYAHNRTDFLDRLGRTQEANDWFCTAMAQYAALPSRRKKYLDNVVSLSRSADHLRREEYEQALACLQNIKCDQAQQQVSQGMLYARCAIGLNQPQRAREWLTFVITNGNRLHIVKEAWAMLEKLENS